MRKAASYPSPRFTDPNDRRMVQIIQQAGEPQPRAVNLLGVPFDGAVLGRRGAREGPSGIRMGMSGFSNFNVELGMGFEGSRIFDIGDVLLENEDVPRAHAAIKGEVMSNLRGDSLLAIVGGDNSISLPAITACSEKFGRLGLVVVDSHFDLRGMIDGKPTSGSSYGLALETVKGLQRKRVAELGVHGFLNSKAYFDKAKKLGVTIVTASDVRRSGARAAAKRAYKVASEGADAVYVSVDLDAIDISYVSGVSAPSAGGLSAAEAFEVAFELARGRKVAAADLVELAPSLDPTGSSDKVAAGVLVYLMAGFFSRS